uniref:folP-SMZ_B27 n=2 Tax=uncultured bacterium TaxID=77133 RepID=UPI002038EC9B|nr:Chain A, folP-SMZ_B27 [uncultured bacterium]8D5H_B Chain B, folP-SMZ_B27 [uncultured bacterium]
QGMAKVKIVGILNVTPNSFHDGGRFVETDKAVVRARELLSQGADIIEIGGESTGPGSNTITADEELARIVPVIRAIRSSLPDANIAVDTYKAEVARKALELGATMINDVSAGRADPKLFGVVARSNAQIVLMYSKDTDPHTSFDERQYVDVVRTVYDFLAERKKAAMSAGIPADRIILDTGLGHFVSSDPQYSFQLLAHLSDFQDLGCKLFLSPSRKSFLAGNELLKTADRLPGTIAASAIAVLHGADYIRTHDVLEVRRGCEIATAINQPPER